jgi:uncharacterized protein
MWRFYGRTTERDRLDAILGRGRWFFVKVTGRRRIGKTSLIQECLRGGNRSVFYVQIPDSGAGGVLSAVADAMDTFAVPPTFARPQSLAELAQTVAAMARGGYIVALDEFQYFNRERLRDFCSLLQAQVDALASDAAAVPGGLLVLGSIHTEMARLLEDRSAPLYNRVTDELELTHLDISSILEILRDHATTDPSHLLFLWSLFEGVPKFYRDCFEQGVLGASRRDLLERIFFQSSSPLRTEADNWFLKELHGRYDVVLKFVARKPGCTHSELVEYARAASEDSEEQVGGYLKILREKYRLIERKVPVFAKPTAKRGRYYIADNFLRAWLAALAPAVSAIAFRPMPALIQQADERLADVEGHALENLAAQLYEERSRKQVGDFSLTARIEGYWDRADTEIDLVALNEDEKRIRLVTCKRDSSRLVPHLSVFDGHVNRFLTAFRQYSSWSVEKVAMAPLIPSSTRRILEQHSYVAEDLVDLTTGL